MKELSVSPNLKERIIIKQAILEDGERFLADHPHLDEGMMSLVKGHNKLLSTKRDLLTQQFLAESAGVHHDKSLSAALKR